MVLAVAFQSVALNTFTRTHSRSCVRCVHMHLFKNGRCYAHEPSNSTTSAPL